MSPKRKKQLEQNKLRLNPLNKETNNMNKLRNESQMLQIECEMKNNYLKYGNVFGMMKKTNNVKPTMDLPIDTIQKTSIYQKFGNPNPNDFYYHITSPKNWEKIQKEGLRSINVGRCTAMGESGSLYFIDSKDEKIWNYLAYNQICLWDNLPYVVLAVLKKSIIGKISGEIVGEFIGSLHIKVKQLKINSSDIIKIGEYTTSKKMYEEMYPILMETIMSDFPKDTEIETTPFETLKYDKAA